MVHTCEICGYESKRSDNFARHLKLKHGNQCNDISNEERAPLEQMKENIQHTFTVDGCHSEGESGDESFTTADSGTEGDCEDSDAEEDLSETGESEPYARTERSENDNETIRNYRYSDSSDGEDVGSPENPVQREDKPRKKVYKKTMKRKLPE